MKITMFMAMSVNGYIADTEGHEDFLSHDGWEVFVELAQQAGVFIIGRKTYEVVLQNYTGFGFLDVNADRIIVTSSPSFKVPEGYTVAHSPLGAVSLAEGLGHTTAILTGGSALNSSFVKDNLIDEVIINVEPAIIGSGTPLFAQSDFARRLKFQEANQRKQGILQLHYAMGDDIA